METIKQLDLELFLWLNGHHNGFFDFVMWWLSDRFIWIPLYVLLLWLIIKTYKKNGWIVAIFLILAVVFTDQCTNIVKYTVERLRPTHNPEISSLVHVLNDYRGGSFGFFSGHSANSFMLATYVFFSLRKSVRLIGPLIYFWAASVAYSRIYLGVHFPGDIIAGAFFGCFAGFAFYLLFQQIIKWRNNGK